MRADTDHIQKNRKDRTGISLPVLLLRIFTIAGVISFIGGFMILRDEMHNSGYTLFDKARIMYTVEDKAFGRMIDAYYEYNPALIKGQQVDQEGLALAEYIDASIQKEIFTAAGQTDLVRKQEERAEDARTRTGIYQGELKRIDQRLQEIRDRKSE